MSRLIGRIITTQLTVQTIITANTAPNRVGSGSESNSPATCPPMKLPAYSATNQIPIICPPTRAGASLVMVLSPTGLRQSSPMVWHK